MNISQENMSLLAWEKQQGLLPAIAQDHISGQVLMMGYMNKEALSLTLQTGKATFFSRSKKRLWQKGETSGNVLRIQHISADCDKDTLLMLVEPAGPACHLGTTSCWETSALPLMSFLKQLDTLLENKKNTTPDASYTASLYHMGIKRIAQKVGEEGVETALAAVVKDKDELINESADLLYHLLVLMRASNLSIEDTIHCLIKRHNK